MPDRTQLRFLRRYFRPDPSVSLWQALLDRFIESALIYIPAALGGVAMTTFAAFTKWLEPWGPVGYGAVGIATALVMVAILTMAYYVFARAQAHREAAAVSRAARLSDHVSPLVKEFESLRLRWSEFYNPFYRPVSKARFVDCELYGPALLIPQANCSFSNCAFAECDIVLFRRGIPHMPASGIVLETCIFDRCHLYRTTLGFWKDEFDRLPPEHMFRSSMTVISDRDG